jgi:hypothetical protein
MTHLPMSLAPGPSATVQINAGQTPTFTVFVKGQ